MPKVQLPTGVTDEDFVLGLLRATGILCVHGSGFGAAREEGFLRIVYLAPLDELSSIYDDFAAFTRDFLDRAHVAARAHIATHGARSGA
jgi:alanine-synthesizing transaminase